jgi:uncharacterized membrane protein
MKINDTLKSEWPQLVLLAVPFLVLIPLWDKFPQRVAIHWGLDGQPNGWADKNWGLLLMPCTNVVLAFIFVFVRRFDSRLKSYTDDTQVSLERVLKIFRLATGIFLAAMALLIDAVALGWKLDVLRLVTLGILIVFVVMGNYLPKLRPNRFVGIRTPWTLKSPEVWLRTNRLFGSIMLIGSLALIIPCIFLPSTWTVILLLVFLAIISFGSMIYSYRCYKSLPLSHGTP